jgi:tRNA threonylcarbamoyl adenosine modification protein (Sua5/YciO/YrdC/YwlC family)
LPEGLASPPPDECKDDRVSAERLPTTTDEEIEAAVDAASMAVRRGRPVVLPTDTVYGIGADAFDPAAVARVLTAKGRGREMPPPVLVADATTLDALASRVPDYARALVERFWPGPLTIVCHQQPSLQWDLGETHGTVAVRVPDHDVARRLLQRTGPLAVSSANITGQPAATDADAAMEMLGEVVDVVIDGGTSPGGEASTIVDATHDRPRVLRVGAIPLSELDAALADLAVTVERPEEAGEPDA